VSFLGFLFSPVELDSIDVLIAGFTFLNTSLLSLSLADVNNNNNDRETAQLINGRAAMVGFVSAIAGEIITKKEAFELLFPAKVVSGVPTHVIDAQNFSLMAFVIAISTLGTITPKFTQDNFDESREFAIFKTNSEMLNGRAAMIGIVSLLVAENFMGHALF